MKYLHNDTVQSGRSMVEMLGVLAVIGVLSIGGIAGYTTAMSYYRANEILNDVTLRATTIATDIATNGALVSGTYKTDLGDENTLGQSVTATPDNGGFLITVGSVDETTCRNILNRDTNDTPIMEIVVNNTVYEGGSAPCTETNTLAFLFANDLGDEIVAPKEPIFPPCTGHSDCDSGICVYGGCVPNDEYCEYYRFTADACKDKNPERPHCLGHRCVSGCGSDTDCTNPEEPYCISFTASDGSAQSICAECKENAHCGDGYYCSGSYESCTESTYNVCRKIQNYQTYEATDDNTYILGDYLTWWDAENFCKALGKSLVPASILNTKGVDGSTNYDYSGTYKTALVGELYTGFGFTGDWVWTSTDYGTSSTSSSKTCGVYYVSLSDGNLYNYHRHNDAHALCW